MTLELLERILDCKTLPSLPAVAVRVLELTQDDESKIAEISAMIQNDQGLAAKVLRTVNSSFYGLRTRCASIDQAIVLLGCNTVKTLALGFSLVQAVKDSESPGFDYQSYWARGLQTATLARKLAVMTKFPQPDEAFLGGLLQDVGMIALYKALGDEYTQVLIESGADRHQLVRAERAEFEATHADVGAMLAARWRLPHELVMPIRFHEHPTAAPMEHVSVVRLVALGNIGADALQSPQPAGPLRTLYTKAKAWFALSEHQVDEAMTALKSEMKEMAGLLSIDAGEDVDPTSMVKQAQAILTTLTDEVDEADAETASKLVDAQTGLPTRLRYNQQLVSAYERICVGPGTLTVALFQAFDARHGDGHSTTPFLPELARAAKAGLDRVFAAAKATLAMYDGQRLALLVPQLSSETSLRIVDATREMLESQASAPGTRIAVSVITMQRNDTNRFRHPGALLEVAERNLPTALSQPDEPVHIMQPASTRRLAA